MKVSEVKKNNQTLWQCVCDCGTVKSVRARLLTIGNALSCGCLRKELASKRSKTHGATVINNPLLKRAYSAWLTMKRRCYDRQFISFCNYGGRGIRVSPKWRSDFIRFLSDMGLPPTPKHSLDRFPNNNGNYAPGNCRWATQQEQCRNTRLNRYLIINGERKLIIEWAEQAGLKYHTLLSRIRYGFTGSKLLTPVTK